MAINATGGPTIVYGQLPTTNGQPIEYNNLAAPSSFWGGTSLMDSRWGYVITGPAATLGFQGSTYIPVVNQIPSALSTTILAASQTMPASGTAIAIATASTTGITVLATSLQVLPSLTTVPVGAIALDGVPGVVTFNANSVTLTGNNGGVQLYDPTKALARNIRLQVNNADTGTFKVSGYDVYGYAMSESISGTTSTTGGVLSGKKAFKFVTSIVPTGTITSTTISAGTGDVYGFPIRADGFSDVDLVVNNTKITANTGFTAAVTTSPATSTTGDVRGTYALQTPSNGTNPLQIYITPRAGNIGSITGLFGVTQA